MNPTLNRNRDFKYQVKLCLKNTFGPDTNSHIAKTLAKHNTIVQALVICTGGPTPVGSILRRRRHSCLVGPRLAPGRV